MSRGKYIVIEGIEAVGKTTVVNRLARELQAAQIPTQILGSLRQSGDVAAQATQRIIDDPRYPINNRSKVLLHNAACTQSLEEVQRIVASGIVCIADHSYLSALVAEYYGRGDITDYAAAAQLLQFAASHVQPDLLILLDAPVSTIKGRMDPRRAAGLDEAYLERLRAGYLWEARQRNLPTIYTTETADIVFTRIWEYIRSLMSSPAQPSSPQVAQPATEVPTTQVQAAPAQATPAAISAPAPQTAPLPASDTAKSKPPAPQADNAVPDTAGKPLTVNQASQLLIPRLAGSRLTTRTERLADFDRKDRNGHYRYYIPPELSGKLRSQYIRTINEIFDVYSKLTEKLTTHIHTTSAPPDKAQPTTPQAAAQTQAYDALRSLLPVAATSSIVIYASGQVLEEITEHLVNSELSEARTIGQQIRTEAHKAMPNLPERAGKHDRTGTPAAYETIERLAEQLLPGTHTGESLPVTLTRHTPRGELGLVPDILYEHSDLPLAQLQQLVAKWPRKRKVEVLTAYIGKQPGRAWQALEKVRYTFDLVCDYGAFLDLQRTYVADSFEQQTLSPRLGYEVPGVVEAAGMTDEFERCFDLSLELYAALQASGFAAQAQYATLVGHKMRWQATYSIREIFRMHEQPTGSETYENSPKIIQAIHAAIATVHPLLGEALRSADSVAGSPHTPRDQPHKLDTAKANE